LLYTGQRHTHSRRIIITIDRPLPAILRSKEESLRKLQQRAGLLPTILILQIQHQLHYSGGYHQRRIRLQFSSQTPNSYHPESTYTRLATMNLIDLFHQKIELFRLEQRYTRRRNRRSTFVSEAQYVDGEYIYSPTSSYSAKCSAGNSDSEETDRGSKDSRESKGSKRISMMGLDKMDWRKGRADKRQSRISVREVKWDEGVRS
jgi:hypothetical protein